MNGLILSGSSGATGPSSFQFFLNPSLTCLACSFVCVKLNIIAMELPSWGHSVVVRLSRYNPSSGTQNAALKADFRAVAFAEYVTDRS